MGNQQNSSSPSHVKALIIAAKSKVALQRNKKAHSLLTKQKETIKYLKEQNLDIAKLKMESIIIEENLVTVYDLIVPLFTMVKERLANIMNQKGKCPEEIQPIIDTLVYASTRIDVEEMHELRKLVGLQYGDSFVAEADLNAKGDVYRNVIDKLKITENKDILVMIRLKKLAKDNNISFDDYDAENYGKGLEEVNSWGNVNPYESVDDNI